MSKANRNLCLLRRIEVNIWLLRRHIIRHGIAVLSLIVEEPVSQPLKFLLAPLCNHLSIKIHPVPIELILVFLRRQLIGIQIAVMSQRITPIITHHIHITRLQLSREKVEPADSQPRRQPLDDRMVRHLIIIIIQKIRHIWVPERT